RKTAVYEHYKEFKTGNEDLTDEPRLGRPREVDRQAVINRIEEDPSMSCRMLADEFDRDPMTIWHILQEAGKHYLKSKWVPHELIMPQQTKRFNACVQLLERHSEDRLDLRDIVTCDEKWIAFDNPHRHN
ncbi:MAG: hypothetical protein DI538_30100, partial [Azospira oryzae]